MPSLYQATHHIRNHPPIKSLDNCDKIQTNGQTGQMSEMTDGQKDGQRNEQGDSNKHPSCSRVAAI